MGTEIEHKFLVIPAKLPRPLGAGEKIEQGYLSTLPTVRVRIISRGKRQRAWLTIKGASRGYGRGRAGRRVAHGPLVRAEFEYGIPVPEARALLALCDGRTLTKIRRRLDGWELDQFTGRHRGLWLAEFELKPNRPRLPPLPPWIGPEVSSDPRFSNACLALLKRPLRFRLA